MMWIIFIIDEPQIVACEVQSLIARIVKGYCAEGVAVGEPQMPTPHDFAFLVLHSHHGVTLLDIVSRYGERQEVTADIQVAHDVIAAVAPYK